MVTDSPDASSAIHAAGYSLVHGSAERSGEESTPSRLPAALRLVEAITRPMTVAEALSSPAIAHGIAAEQFEDEME